MKKAVETRSSRFPVALALLMLATLLTPTLAAANANVTIVNLDAGTGQGLDDPSPVAPIGGNPGTTLGQQRLNVFLAAANIWGSLIDSSVTIEVDATFTPLQCNAFSGVLGAAGAQTVHANFAGAPRANTWYHQALANSLTGSDLDPAASDLIAFFNSSIDNNNNCLSGTNWYLGLDSNPGGDIDFFTVVLHEIGHGLGFSSFVDESTGQLLAGQHDIWNSFLFDATTGLRWRQMNNAQRVASAVNTGELTWAGANVTAEAPTLSSGVNASTGFVQMYAPNPVEPGSSVSHYDTAVTPNALMEPFITGPSDDDLDITIPLFTDIGWATGGYRLSLPVPGFAGQTNTFTTRGATPGQTTFFIYGFTPGSRAVPGCPGVFADIQDVNVFSNGPANADGKYIVPVPVPAISGLTILFQIVELSTCQVSDLVSYTWP